ncbi:MAG: rsbU 1 [Planctomycetota bacterium]|nr:rsbU 1 [Planctomycetota bacterium]
MHAHRNPAPTLRMVKGAAPLRTFELLADRITLGRKDCQIIVADERVSKLHAEIRREGAGFVLVDLDSRNGTKVNGGYIAEPTRLRDGDQIVLCEHVFEFRNPLVTLQDDNEGSSTILGSIELKSSSTLLPKLRAEDKLPAILEISRDIGKTLQLREVLEKTLASLFKIFPQADRGFVLLREPEGGDLVPHAIRHRKDEPGPLTLSTTVFNHVMDEGRAILSTNLSNDSRFLNAGSLHGDAIRTMMCVPLFDQQRATIGMIQIDTRNQRSLFSQEDLDLLVAVAGPVSLAVDNARLHDTLIRLITIEASLRNAHEVQLALLPEKRPDLPGYVFWDAYAPAESVGGDYYDYLPLPSPEEPPSIWALTLGDVSGHGMPAALLMAKLSAEARTCLLTEPDPVRAIEKLNRQLSDARFPERFITFVYVRLDLQTNRITVVNAGHMEPYVRRASGQLEVLGEHQGGPPLAIMDDIQFQSVETELHVGDVVILYTDGVNEAMNPEDHIFKLEGLRKAILAAPLGAEAIGESIVHAVRKHAAGCPQSDDIAIVCFGRV